MTIEQNFPKDYVLICPLQWGFGHIARCIPIATNFHQKNFQVLMMVNERYIAHLQNLLPNVIFLPIKSYNIYYSSFLPAWLMFLLQLPIFIASQFFEYIQIENIVKRYKVKILISDNHYGSLFVKIRKILVIHQICVQFPYYIRCLEKLFCKIHLYFIHRADQVWIPDYSGEENLSGKLSHLSNNAGKFKFIGPLSRFTFEIKDFKNDKPLDYIIDILVILSGQEPQRSILEKKLIFYLGNSNKNVVFVRGTITKKETNTFKNITYIDFADDKTLVKAIKHAKIIICRAGYSTIMDLVSIEKSAILIPTPGQTEQEYLAKYLSEKRYFKYLSQSKLHLLVKMLEQPFENVEFKQIFEETNINNLF